MKQAKKLIFFILFFSLFIFCKPALALSWEVVMDNGFGEGEENRAISSLVVFGDYIYAGVTNETDGAKIFRSNDGVNWTQVNESGFGDSTYTDTLLFTDGRYLYAGFAGDEGVSGFKLFKTTNGTDWTQIGTDGFGSIDNYAITKMIFFAGKLYISVFYINHETYETGVRIYRIDNDSSWTQVNEDGFGDPDNLMSYAMNIFNDKLYVGTGHIPPNGPEIWRTQNGTEWFQVVDDGFGEENGIFFTNIFSFHQKIYASMASATGFELWRSESGNEGEWEQVGGDGFGNVDNLWASPFPVIVNDVIYLGTGNEINNIAKIYTSRDGENWVEEDNSSFVDADDEGVFSGTLFKNRIYFAILNENGSRIIRSEELPPLSIITESSSLPEATLGEAYSYQIEYENGTPPFVCTWEGDLPEGMEVTEDCKIQGTPREASEHTFTVYITDSGIPAQRDEKEFTLIVKKPDKTNKTESYVKNEKSEITELPETGNKDNILGIKNLCPIVFLLIGFILISPQKRREKKEL